MGRLAQIKFTRILDDGRKLVNQLDIPYGGQNEGLIDLAPGTPAGDFEIPFGDLDGQYVEVENGSDVEALVKLNGSANLYSLSPGAVLVLASPTVPEGTVLGGLMVHTEATTVDVGGIKYRVIGTKSAGPPPFIPGVYAGNTLDLDASIGFDPALWEDQSGLGHDFVQASAGVQPLLVSAGGFDAADFDGVDDQMTQVAGDATLLLSTTQFAIFCVCMVDAVNTNSANYSINDSIISLDNARCSLALRSAPEMVAADYDAVSFNGDVKPITLGAVTLLAMRMKALKLYASVDGSALGAGANTLAIDSIASLARLGVNTQGGPDYLNVKIIRLIIYNVSMVDVDFTAAMTALKLQYGIV